MVQTPKPSPYNPKYTVFMFIGVLIVLIPFTIYTFRSSKEAGTPTQTTVVPTSVQRDAAQPPPQQTLSITPNISHPSEKRAITNAFFSVVYPADWKVQIVADTVDKQIFLAGPQVDKGTKIPSVYIDARRASDDASLRVSKNNLVKTFNFIEVPLRDSIFTAYYRGSFPFSNINGKLVSVASQERAAFLFQNGVSYELDFVYPGDQIDNKYESLFKEILSSVTFPQQ